ncbi:MAG: hypothetical protein AB7K68_07775 [Bacteriovoracia bacterium]
MSDCAYCDKPYEKNRTREHVIPSWYLKEDGISFNERSRNKVSNDEIVIRDVCAGCNNGPLSRLDAYGKSLYLQYFQNFVFAEEQVALKYDYQELVKWLLKISYNSARANNSDPEILGQYRSYLIGDAALPNGVMLFLSMIAPSVDDPEAGIRAANRLEPDSHKPDIFRVGVGSFPGIDGIYWVNRVVSIGSFRFLLFVPDLVQANIATETAQVLNALRALPSSPVRLTDKNEVISPKPYTDFASDFSTHMFQNPVAVKRHLGAYSEDPEEAEAEKALEQLHAQKADIFTVVIDRMEIESGDITATYQYLTSFISNREGVLKYFGKVEVTVFGYDDDPRELYQIAEVRKFLKELDAKFPYWLALQSDKGMWIKVLFACLNKTERIGGKVHWEKEDDTLIPRWFMGLNEVTHRFALPINKNRAQSDLVKKLIFDHFQ